MRRQAPDPKLLSALPEVLRDLPFGSPEFKQKNAEIVAEDEQRCAPVVRGMPTWINLTGTTVCNLKCVMCPQFLDPNQPKWFMSDEVYERVVTELYAFARTVQFTAAGEPLMTPRIEQKLEDLIATHTKLEIVTNGTLMMRESRFRERLLETLELVTFSVDGATRETYNAIRQGAEWDQVLDNIRAFAARRAELPAERRPGMNFNYILMERALEEAPLFVELVHELGGDTIVFNHLVSFNGAGSDERLGRDPEHANEWLGRIQQTAEQLGVRVQLPPPFTTGTAEPRGCASDSSPPSRPCGPPPVKCWFLWQRAYVTHEGAIAPCCLAGIPHMGNMMDAGFRAVWNNDEYQRYRRHVFTDSPYGPCASCYFIYPNPELAGADGYEFETA